MNWNEIRAILLNVYTDSPDDEVLSIGHWDKDELPNFCARLRITVGMLRNNKFSEET